MAGKTCIRISLGLFFCLLFITLSISNNSASVSLGDNPNEAEKKVEAAVDESAGLVGERVCYAKITSSNGVNIRAGPSSKTKKLGAYPYGANIQIKGTENNGESVEGNRTWYKTYRGWITAQYTKRSCNSHGPVKNPNPNSIPQANSNDNAPEDQFNSESALA